MDISGVSAPTRPFTLSDCVNRNFLLGSSEMSKKVHWVRWQKVTKPKEEGGLGL